MNKQDIIKAHKFSSYHKMELEIKQKCGCFYCLKIFDSTEITEWIFDHTATCPYCGIDSIIGEYSGYPVTTEFLENMRIYWF